MFCYLAEESLLDPEGVARGEHRESPGHGGVPLLLLQTVRNDKEGPQPDGHPLGGQDHLDGPPDAQQVKNNVPHGKIKALLKGYPQNFT